MNKTAIKNFAISARNKLIAEIAYKAGLMGITESGIKQALPQSGGGMEYYDIGTREPYAISGNEVKQRRDLVDAIQKKQKNSDYKSAYEAIIDETAYTWFNRLIAVRFMEVNDYLPSCIRVLSSISGKLEPDIVTTPFEAQMDYTDTEKEQIIGWKNEEKPDEVFRYLFLKQCNELNAVLPALFEKVSDYTELLLTVSFTDKDGVVYHLVHDIPEEDFNVEIGGQVEIIGWLYQYYNTEPKAKVFARASCTKIKKEEIPAATQLFTPDWIVRYMVENSLGRLWVEGHPNDELKARWKYYLEEAEQEPEVQTQLAEIRKGYAVLNPEDLLCIDPCMGSGHILCYFFDVLMQIYKSQGYTQRDAAQSILEHNIYGLDIDDRAYQLAYFAVMMKARQYDRRILTRGIQPHVYAVVESNGFNKAQLKYFGAGMDELTRNNVLNQVNGLLDQLYDAKEYGSILSVDKMDWALLREFAENTSINGQMDMDVFGIDKTQELLKKLIDVGEALAQKYWSVTTNPPYMGSRNGMDGKLYEFVNTNFPDSKTDLYSIFIERCSIFTKKKGFYAMITQHGWLFLTSFSKLREKTLQHDFVNMLHLGARAFDEISGEVVQTVSFVERKINYPEYIGTYLRLLVGDSELEKEKLFYNERLRYFLPKCRFCVLEEKPIAYWLSEAMFGSFRNKTLGEYAKPRQGMATSDNNRFLRLWFEVEQAKIRLDANDAKDAAQSGAKWFPYNKGGGFRKWYGNNDYLINWENDGREVKALAISLYKCVTRTIKNIQFYFQEGITWSTLASGSFNARCFKKGFLFDTKGSSCYFDDSHRMEYCAALLNSSVANELLKVLAPTLDYNAGSIAKIPVVWSKKNEEELSNLVHECCDYSKQDWDSFETSWDFQYHPLLGYLVEDERETLVMRENMNGLYSDVDTEIYISLENAYHEWERVCTDRFNHLKDNEEELNRIFIDIYGLQDELTPEVEDKDITVRKADLQRDIKSLISYAVGCMFGRYSLDMSGLAYAGGEWDDSKYSTFIPDEDNVLPITDEEYFEDDIVGLFCAWLKKVYGVNTLEENLDFIAKALGNKGNTSREVIRNYFLNDFFKDHCSTYSVTGSGKRPIYWLYDSGKQNGFKALVYMHRYDADTTGRVRADYLHRMEKVYESEIGRMEETMENSKNNREVVAAMKRKEKMQKQLKECREYDEKIAHLALSRIEIDLDDGVKVNYRKVQTDVNGKFYEILADSKTIMVEEK